MAHKRRKNIPQMAWGKRYGAFGGWETAAGKVEVLLWLVGLDVGISVKVKLNQCLSISRKVTWESQMVQVNQTVGSVPRN